ncbi:MAG: methyl-accepting chemotaxis protein [Nitrospirota bacterium]
MKRTWRRRNYFIKKELQGKYIFSFFIFVVAGSILFTLIFSYLSLDTMTIVYKNHNLQLGKTPLILIKEILSAHWIFVLTAGIAVAVISMFLTHRFAGPMYRFEKSVEEMIKGDFSFEIRLRRKDEGKEFAEKMNRLIVIMSSRISDMRRLSDEIAVKLEDISPPINRMEEAEAVVAGLDQMRVLTGRLKDLLYSFKIKNEL